MMTLPPCNCTICYQMYNNERSPLILTKCGHTFCKECLERLQNSSLQQVTCPECKQVTELSDSLVKSLPKNRGLLNLIIYNESLSKSGKREETQGSNSNNSSGKKSALEAEKSLVIEYESAINKIEETYNKIIEEHTFLQDISEVLILKEVDEALDHYICTVNEYRSALVSKIKQEFEKINLIKSFKSSIEKYKQKLNEINLKIVYSCSDNSKAVNTSVFEEGRSSLLASMVTSLEEEIVPQCEGNNCSMSVREISDLKGEIEFMQLYNLTLRNYSKDIYDPCKFFFVNKFQNEKLLEDFKKLLKKTVDFEESVNSFNLNKINDQSPKKILKEINEACGTNNTKKLQAIFSHFRVNANFLYSDSPIDSITQSSTVLDFHPNNLNNNSNNNNGFNNTFSSSFNSQLHLSVPGNQRSNATNSILRNFANNANRNNQNTGNNSNSSNNNNSSSKEKVVSLYNSLKLIKDKTEQSKVIKYLIDEMNYLPLKVDSETRIELNLARDSEWKIPLTIY